ncbi:hypothetical protein MLD38_003411 [Melastoma candidum]|nr:hypothetical protein MLD38_003411 [Melastoma candidum]
MVGIGFNVSLHEQGSTPFLIDPTLPALSSPSVHSLILNYVVDPLPQLNQQSGYGDGSLHGGGGPQFMGEYSDFGTGTLIPQLLESLSPEGVYVKAEESKVTDNINALNNNINNYNMNDMINNFSKIGCTLNSGIGSGNFWNNSNNNHQIMNGEDIKIGEWDLEELMRDVSSFPFPDFHCQ